VSLGVWKNGLDMTEKSTFDRNVRRIGLAAAVVHLSFMIAITVALHSTHRDPSTSHVDGYRNAAEVSIGGHPTASQIEAACPAYFLNDLTDVESRDQEGPYAAGCVQGMQHRLGIKAGW
jgi:hypothetical protein